MYCLIIFQFHRTYKENLCFWVDSALGLLMFHGTLKLLGRQNSMALESGRLI